MQFVEERLGHLDGRVGHDIGILQDQPLFIREDTAGGVISELLDLLRRDAFMSADRRPDINSKGTPDERGDAQFREVLELGRNEATASQ